METKSTDYTHYLSIAPEYVWDKKGQCHNTKTCKSIKKSYNNGCIGYFIRGKFNSLTKLRPHLVIYQKQKNVIKRNKWQLNICPMIVCSEEIYEL